MRVGKKKRGDHGGASNMSLLSFERLFELYSWKSGADGVNSSMSWFTVFVSRAYLSRWRLASRSFSEKPSSI